MLNWKRLLMVFALLIIAQTQQIAQRVSHARIQPLDAKEWSDAQREKTIRRMIRQVGWMAGEFSQFPRYTRGRIERPIPV